ncbi:hypothetical protein EGW08_017368 [Elysia chlorotica]|uniref:PARG catalytic Macro domain-containing protein n=1 Tax=Elysia chlorotica TaxID=188477 RepID=A0A3S1AXL7_ELYCH|nr:hypothetical protein EGW08_017368 [Elysia chlorotica]
MCELRLCPVSVQHTGVIEDSGSGAVQVDFANRSIGGGVLGRGKVQEEIYFSICPELLVALLFMETLEPNEAIFISGFEQFSRYRGYSESFRFAGNYEEPGQLLSLVAIDAVNYKSKPVASQYEESSVLRDINKAVVGFSHIGDRGRGRPAPPAPDPCRPGGSRAQDVAADMVTSVMMDAVSQAGEEARTAQSVVCTMQGAAEIPNVHESRQSLRQDSSSCCNNLRQQQH